MHSAARRIEVVEVSDDGLSTTVLPAAIAGATARAAWLIGTFQGVITPTTPMGSLRVKEW